MASNSSGDCVFTPYLAKIQRDNITREDLFGEVSTQNVISITVVSLIGTFALLGNLTLIVVFFKRYQTSSYRTFTLWIASFNVAVCIFIFPLLISFYANELNFPNKFICKFGVTVAVGFLIMDHCMLLIVAVERYRKVYHPFYWQVSDRNLNFLFVVAILVAVTLSFPNAIFFGRRKVDTGIGHIRAILCFISDNQKYSDGPFKYYLAVNILSIVTIFVLGAIYARIIKEINRYKDNFQSNEVFPEETGSPPFFTTTTRTLEMRRTTLTLFTVTVSFLCTTLPITITTLVVSQGSAGLDCNIQHYWGLLYRVFGCISLFQVSSIPCIYIFCDNYFKYELKESCCLYRGIPRTRL